MALRDLLEDFAAPASVDMPVQPVMAEPDPAIIDAARKEAFAEGYLAGQQAAEEAADAAQKDKLEKISALLSDMDFAAAEIETAMADRITPVLTSMIGSVLPRAIAAGLPVAVEEELSAVAKNAMEGPLTLRVSSSYADVVAELPSVDHRRVSLVLDEDLDDQTILVQSENQERLLDFGQALTTLEEAVRAFADTYQEQTTPTKEVSNG